MRSSVPTSPASSRCCRTMASRSRETCGRSRRCRRLLHITRSVDVSAGRVALLQLCDSLFPVGSFAHSDGLEAAVTDCDVSDGAGLRRWLDAQLHGQLVQLDAPGVRVARTAMLNGDLESVASIDDELYALRPAASSRDAPRMQGS